MSIRLNQVQAEIFQSRILVRFADCDPAGIVFYPRYLEMFNGLVEDWFREGLELSFGELIAVRGWGVPTVHLDVDFLAPSRMGETLRASLGVWRIGRSSIHLDVRMNGPNGEDRVRGKIVLVLTDRNTSRARTIPDEFHARIARYFIPDLEREADANSATTQLGPA